MDCQKACLILYALYNFEDDVLKNPGNYEFSQEEIKESQVSKLIIRAVYHVLHCEDNPECKEHRQWIEKLCQ